MDKYENMKNNNEMMVYNGVGQRGIWHNSSTFGLQGHEKKSDF